MFCHDSRKTNIESPVLLCDITLLLPISPMPDPARYEWFHQSANGSVQTATVQSSPVQSEILMYCDQSDPQCSWTGLGSVWTDPIRLNVHNDINALIQVNSCSDCHPPSRLCHLPLATIPCHLTPHPLCSHLVHCSGHINSYCHSHWLIQNSDRYRIAQRQSSATPHLPFATRHIPFATSHLLLANRHFVFTSTCTLHHHQLHISMTFNSWYDSHRVIENYSSTSSHLPPATQRSSLVTQQLSPNCCSVWCDCGRIIHCALYIKECFYLSIEQQSTI